MIRPVDAHTLARLVCGREVNGELASLPDDLRPLAEHLAAVEVPDNLDSQARREALAAARRPIWQGVAAARPDLAEAVRRVDPESPPPEGEADDGEPIRDGWPAPPAPVAFRGVAGELTRLVEPHTEADPAAVLFSVLAGFGNAVGRYCHQFVGSTRHCSNVNVCMVGPSGRGRKGTSADIALAQLSRIYPDWARDRIASGLSTGEGLIYHVRDAVYGKEPIKEKGRIIEYQDVMLDAGVDDKRLFAIETELAGVLRKLSREGNSLSAVIRQAYDGDRLANLTKSCPLRAHGAHVSLLCHTTREDLAKYLSDTDAANGFANRFLWVCARRSKLLPDGGRLDTVDFGPVQERLQAARNFASDERRLIRSDDARDRWREWYGSLTRSRPGLYGAVTGRAEAMVLRLSGLYAILDCSAEVMVEHVDAALAAWDYCERSARYVFGDALADTDADRLYKAIRESPGGLSKTEAYRQVFGAHKTAAEIALLLAQLLSDGLIRQASEATRGRPVTRFLALDATQ